MSRNAKRLLSYIMCLAMLLVAALPAMPAYAEAQATDSAAPAEGGEAAAEADQAPAEETPQAPGADAEATDGADAEPAPGGEGENDAADAADSPEGADSADDPDATDTTEGADGAEADPAGDAGEAPPADAAPLSDEAAESAAPLAPLAEPEPIIKAAQPWQDHNADTADRLQSLVDALTLDEKIAIAGGSLSAVNRLGVNGGRGGGGEGLHGVAWDGQATMFPSSLGLSQSFDKKLLEDIGDAIANESLAGGISSAGRLAPVVDLLRDPRYGRAYETLGEDAYLTGTLGIAMANGMSKRTGEDGYIRFIPILKHFMAYNAEINRLWVASSISPRNIAEYYSKAFKYPVAAGASYSLMNSYPLVAGKPMSVSPLQYELLYKWTPKFPGTDHYEYLTTNDYGSGSSMWVHSQRYFEDTTLGRALGIAEGTKNGQMGWSLRDFGSAGTAQYEALARGMATEKDFEENAKRAIAIALRTGDLDQIGGPQSPYLPNAGDDDPSNDTTADIYGTRQSQIQANKGLALQASQEQIVLLKNEGNTLPLNTTSAENTGVTLLGPLADQVLKDFYSGSYKYRITIYDALRNTLGTDKVSFNRAVDTVAIQAPGGKYLQGGTAPAYVSPGSGGPDTQNVVASSGAAPVLGDAADASRLYRLYDYGSENILLQSVANDRYLQVTNRTAAQNPHTLQNNTSAPGEGNLDETAGGQNLSYSTFQKFRLAPTALGITTPYSGVYGIYHLLSGDGINDGVGLAYDVDDEDLNRGSYVKFDNAKGTVVTKIPDVSDELAKDPSYADAWVSVESGAGLGGYPWRTEHNVKSPVDAVDDSEGIVDGLDSDQKFTFSNIQSVEDAASAAISATNDDDAPIILVVGYEPHLNAREGIDLYKTGLSPQQTRLVQYVTGYDDATTTNGGLGKEVILIVKTGNPMTIDKKIHENPNVKAIIEIGHTGQEEGSAIVSALFDGGYTVPAEDGKWFPDREYAAEGQSYQAVFSEYPGYLPSGGSRTIPAYAPAGRLSATWYDGINQMLGASEDHAPASYIFPNYDETKNDNLSNMNGTSNTGILTYDIIKGERTYQYLQGAPLYPFGYGLTYSEFEYSGVTVSSISDGKFTVTGKVKNKGQTYTSDEVVQVYSVFDGVASRIKQPVKRLIAYDRLKAIEPSGVREFSFEIDLVDMLGLWDVETAKYIVENGTYTITVGSSSAVTALSVGGTYDTLTVDDSNGGTDASVRDLTSELTLAENMDDYGSTAGSVDDVEFISVSDAYNSNTAIQFRKDNAWAAYKNVRLNGETSLTIRAGSDRDADVEVRALLPGTLFTGSEGTLIATFSSLTNTRPSAIATGLGIGPVAPYPGSADG
ncbi:MAG: glycoside hydrolase family 3 C-terminal domain-containing protein, partial [Clostridiales bacterium]|nr:glycoside hydrolase family 3 C-terminal domain-containing protein [Clostridiales bacterium]